MGNNLPLNQKCKTPEDVAKTFGDEFTMPNNDRKINGVLNVGTMTSNTSDYKLTNLVSERIRPDEEIIAQLKEYCDYANAIRTELMHTINEANETLLNDTQYALAFIDDKSVEIELCNEDTHEMHLVEEAYKDTIPLNVQIIRDLVSGYTFQMIHEYKVKQHDLVISALRDKYKTIARGIIINHVEHMERLTTDYAGIFETLSFIYEDFRPAYNTRNLNGDTIGTYDYDSGKFVNNLGMNAIPTGSNIDTSKGPSNIRAYNTDPNRLDNDSDLNPYL